ncbi:N-acetyltransferase [Roseovarius sp. TE539]|uniref:GNAT family N-acetyltransferase n=1 Tax=Roseovarius sp. TE539 TaxID=2249812 RepID=UPI000DDC7719|nr:GNAT family N-acetyltransferase [Roseovarius sp. TE539]RBI76016.1 N-acetyltransferase [Roseovarius sp. TE539]
MTLRHADTPVLETERLRLRAFDARDVARGVNYLTQVRTVYMGGPYSRAAAWDHCAGLIGHWAIHGFGLFVLCLEGDDQAIGDCGLLMPGGYPEIELGWGIWDPALEGRGYAREAARAVRAHAYGTFGLSTLVSYIDPENARSIALAERLGCTLDAGAAIPDLPGWTGTIVYRHPAPEAA